VALANVFKIMGIEYNIPRKNVVLKGIPYKWNTNLQDEALHELYALIGLCT
jgi:hypothetical protein